jgi:putative membrane protein
MINKTDLLAIERTKLANERTFLAYFRTFIVLLSSAIAILKLEVLQEIRFLGYGLLVVSPILLLVGIFRYLHMKKHLKGFYQ